MFKNTYAIYHDIRKRHEAMFKMIYQSKDESLKTYLKHFLA